MMKTELLIDNQDVSTAQYMEVRDPGRLDHVVGLVAKGDARHVEQAVEAAQRAFHLWRTTPLETRISLILKAADKLEQAADALARTVSGENGMLLAASRGEIALAVSGIRNLADLAEGCFEQKLMEDGTGWVSIEKKPMGVIAAIVPWNAPIVLTVQKLAPAVIAGNTVVFKPSPFAPIGITAALRMISELFPPGVINVVHGDGDVGAALTTHPLVRKISFTGGGATAKHVMRAAAESLKSIHLELGGNDPAIVLGDADLDKIVPQITAGVFRRSGQYCFAIKRIYVPDSLYDSFFEKMRSLTDEFKIGHQLNENATLGPMNNRQQFENVKRLIEAVKGSKAQVFELGQKLEPDNWDNGYYLRPVIVKDAEPDQEIVACEQFGPVIPLIRYRTEQEAILMANNSEFGLGSSIWSSDFERAVNLAREIEAGMTFINGNGTTSLGHKFVPFGGIKQSGIGRENSEIVFDEFIEYHAINYHKSI
jgi:acyl-CoA reductase-like NAD-dependent aldehyde dehydrogenase